MYGLDRVVYQLYSSSKIITLLQTLVELWHFQSIGGKNEKLRKQTALCHSFERSTLLVYTIVAPNVVFLGTM